MIILSKFHHLIPFLLALGGLLSFISGILAGAFGVLIFKFNLKQFWKTTTINGLVSFPIIAMVFSVTSDFSIAIAAIMVSSFIILVLTLLFTKQNDTPN